MGDIAADTGHLFDDSKYGNIYTKLDVQERERTREMNAREDRAFQYKSKLLTRAEDVAAKSYEYDMKILRASLKDIVTRSPHFDSFCKYDRLGHVKRGRGLTQAMPGSGNRMGDSSLMAHKMNRDILSRQSHRSSNSHVSAYITSSTTGWVTSCNQFQPDSSKVFDTESGQSKTRVDLNVDDTNISNTLTMVSNRPSTIQTTISLPALPGIKHLEHDNGQTESVVTPHGKSKRSTQSLPAIFPATAPVRTTSQCFIKSTNHRRKRKSRTLEVSDSSFKTKGEPDPVKFTTKNIVQKSKYIQHSIDGIYKKRHDEIQRKEAKARESSNVANGIINAHVLLQRNRMKFYQTEDSEDVSQ